MDIGAVYYAKADGSFITEVAHPMVTPNGVGLSPDGTVLYVADTEAARLWAFPIEEPGVVRKDPWPSPHGGCLIAGMGGYQRFDSLAVQEDGRICVATLINGGITVISPDGRHTEHHPMPDPMTTNICFGGPDGKTAYITLSWTGRLVAVDWPVAGLRLHHAGQRTQITMPRTTTDIDLDAAEERLDRAKWSEPESILVAAAAPQVSAIQAVAAALDRLAEAVENLRS